MIRALAPSVPIAATLALAAPAGAALPPQGPPVQADQPAPANTIVGPPAPSSNPVFVFASRTYRTMTATSLAMSKAEGIRKKHVPTPTRMYDYLSSKASRPYFTRIRRASNIRPGDVFILEGGVNHDGAPFAGHAMIAASGPLLLSDGTWAVTVYDSTGDPHGADDSRPWDTRTQPSQANPSTLHSGLGFGTIAIHTNASGAPTRMSWSVGVGEEPHPFLVSRPTPEHGARSAQAGTTPAPS